MAATQEREDRYTAMLRRLLPYGRAWPEDQASGLLRLLSSMAIELARVEERAVDVIRESDPNRTLELLPDWERVMGLPDPCIGQPKNVDARRRVILAFLGHQGGASRQFFIDLAAIFGYVITIEEHRPAGIGSAIGDTLTQGAWVHAFTVHSTAVTAQVAGIGSAIGDALADWGNDTLECVINRTRPAHTIARFVYDLAEDPSQQPWLAISDSQGDWILDSSGDTILQS